MRQSEPEAALAWQMRIAGLPIPIRELRFAPPRRWRLDFAWETNRLAVEVDGGIWTRGRHTRALGYQADAEKANHACLLGWRVLHVTPQHIGTGEALRWIEEALTWSTIPREHHVEPHYAPRKKKRYRAIK